MAMIWQESGYTEGHEFGFTEGHESGYIEGHDFGYTQGRDSILEIMDEINKGNDTIENLQHFSLMAFVTDTELTTVLSHVKICAILRDNNAYISYTERMWRV